MARLALIINCRVRVGYRTRVPIENRSHSALSLVAFTVLVELRDMHDVRKYRWGRINGGEIVASEASHDMIDSDTPSF